MIKDINYYSKLPYKIIFHPAGEGGYVAEIAELPGCISQGETMEEALSMIQDAKIAWLESAIEDCLEITEPTTEEYSGKLNIRIPKSLHRKLAIGAREEKVSLNQYILYHLARGTGYQLNSK